MISPSLTSGVPTMTDQMMLIGIAGPLIENYRDYQPEEALARHLRVPAKRVIEQAVRLRSEGGYESFREYAMALMHALNIRRTPRDKDELVKSYLGASAAVRPRKPWALAAARRFGQRGVVTAWPGSDAALTEIAKQSGIKRPEFVHVEGYWPHEDPRDSLCAAARICQVSPTDVLVVSSYPLEVVRAETAAMVGYLLDKTPSEKAKRIAVKYGFDIINSLEDLYDEF
jgi:hypothetical protein